MTPREAVRELRTELGLSQEAFGRQMGWTLKTVSRYENYADPTGTNLYKLGLIAMRVGLYDVSAVLLDQYHDELRRDGINPELLDYKGPLGRFSFFLNEASSALRRLEKSAGVQSAEDQAEIAKVREMHERMYAEMAASLGVIPYRRVVDESASSLPQKKTA